MPFKAEVGWPGLEAPGRNWGSLSHPILFTMCAMQFLSRRWQDFLSNKTEFYTVLRRMIFFSLSVAASNFLRASCRNEQNEMLVFSITASGLIIRHSRNNCFGRSQPHFILTGKESSIFYLIPVPL